MVFEHKLFCVFIAFLTSFFENCPVGVLCYTLCVPCVHLWSTHRCTQVRSENFGHKNALNTKRGPPRFSDNSQIIPHKRIWPTSQGRPPPPISNYCVSMVNSINLPLDAISFNDKSRIWIGHNTPKWCTPLEILSKKHWPHPPGVLAKI